jgi:hypothetical protein
MTDSSRTRVNERRLARSYDRGQRQQVGGKNRAKVGETNETSDDGKNDGARMM